MAISKEDLKKTQKRVDSSIGSLNNSKSLEYVRKSVTIDKRTVERVNEFRNKKGLDFSSALRFIINEYLDDK